MRILPALSFVLLSTTLAAYILLPVHSLKTYSQSLVSVVTFSSNLYFYLTSGYFAAASHEKPLLHTWSLAVEEQYYLFFPLMIVLVWSRGQKWLISSIALLASLSLLLAHAMSSLRSVDANFYLIFSRAWELLLGSLLAFRGFQVGRWQKEVLGILGFLMITSSVAFFDSYTPFPSLLTLIPVLGSSLIIAFVDSASLVGRLLSNTLLVFIGLLSYSLYLWHQPVFALLRLKSIGEPSNNMFLGATLVIFALAAFSWHYVERPFRDKSRFSRKSIFQYSLASIAVFLLIGLAGHSFRGFSGRFNLMVDADSTQHSPKRDECHTGGENYSGADDACRYFGKNVTWAVFGDSHTVELGYSLAKRLERYDLGLLHLSFSACSPSLLNEATQSGCTRWLNESLAYLEERKDIENVLLGFRHSFYLYREAPASSRTASAIDPKEHLPESPGDSVSVEVGGKYWQSLHAIISRLLGAGKNVHVLYPIPELPVHINVAITPFSVFESHTSIDLERAISAKDYFDRNAFLIDRLDSLPYGDNLFPLRPFQILGDGDYSPAAKERQALYFDSHHLSVFGSGLIVETINLDRD